jgi:hypothetical protein
MKSISTNFNPFTGWTGTLIILAAIFFSGCSSMDKPESAGFAAVVITNQSIQTIQQAAVTVFQNNGYQAMTLGDGSIGFEREATEREQRQYAGFVGAHEGEKVVMRVRIKIEPKNPGAYWLSCKAYAVTNPGQGVFETTTALFGWQSKPYQKLLDQVAARLAMSPSAP